MKTIIRPLILLPLLLSLHAEAAAGQTGNRLADDDQRPGFQVTSDRVVTVYSSPRFGGRSERFSTADRRLDDNRIGNDGVVSARIPDGCTLTLFEHFDFRGRSIQLDADVANLAQTRFGAREASSLKVDCGAGGSSGGGLGGHHTPGPEDTAEPDSRQLGDRRGALLFSESAFRGRHQFFKGSIADLGRRRLGDDAVSSVRVADGCRLTLFAEPNFKGNKAMIDRDLQTLRGTAIGADTASSLEVDCTKGRDGSGAAVTLFADSHYRGHSVVITNDVRRLSNSRLGDDRVGSLRLGTGCRVTLYGEADFRGRSNSFDHDTPSLVGTPVGPDNASSLQIDCRDQPSVIIEPSPQDRGVVLFDQRRFNGVSAPIRGDVRRLSETPVGNDRARSIRIPRGCEAMLFVDADFRGRSIRLDESVEDLDRTPVGSDAVSSIRVRCR